MNIKYENSTFSSVCLDITNYCNARCVFCLNDWKQKPFNMSKDCFKKALQVLPFTIKEGFMLSCLFEPSIHPNYIDILSILPSQFKDTCSFTTNLIKKLTPEDIHSIAQSNLKYINISLETYDLNKYSNLSGTEYSNFYENLEKVNNIFSLYPNAPKLRFITMILNDNADEIMEIAQRTQNIYQPFSHEFRVPYFVMHEEVSNFEAQLLPRNIIDSIVTELRNLPFDNIFISDFMDIKKYNQAKLNQSKERSFEDWEELYLLPYRNHPITFNSDGTGHLFNGLKPFDLNTIDNPFIFFSKKVIESKAIECDFFLVPDHFHASINNLKNRLFEFSIDEICIFDHRFICIQGWVFFEYDLTKPYYIKIRLNSEEKYYKIKRLERLDVSAAFNDTSLNLSGFESLIDTNSWTTSIFLEFEISFICNLGKGIAVESEVINISFDL